MNDLTGVMWEASSVNISGKGIKVVSLMDIGDMLKVIGKEEFKKERKYAHVYGRSLKIHKGFESRWQGDHGLIWRVL